MAGDPGIRGPAGRKGAHLGRAGASSVHRRCQVSDPENNSLFALGLARPLTPRRNHINQPKTRRACLA